MNACETMEQVFKDDFKLGKDFKMGRVVFLFQKSTLPMKFMNACENYGTSFLRWFKLGKDFKMG